MNAESGQKAEKTTKTTGNWLWRYTRFLLLGFICWLLIRQFVFQGMYIPSNSMEGTLYEGDYVYVNKLAYGPRSPITLLSIPFTDRWLDWVHLPYYRFPGFDTIKINDVIVFNLPTDTALPIDHRQLYIKRCVALPGDSIAIVRGNIFVNGMEIASPEKVKYMYSVVLNTNEPDSLFKRNGIRGKFTSNDNVHYVMRITFSEANTLQEDVQTISVVRSILDADRYDYKMFPQNTSKAYRWNADNFGPLYVPKKDRTIELSLNNIHLYKDIIAVHEHNTLENRDDSIYINGVHAKTYTFKMNYYFVMGDNRYDSQDSRYWGFVPEDHVVGRASW